MPASKEKLTQSPELMKQLGIIAGGGALPDKLVHACEMRGITPFIVGFEGQTDPALVQGRNHMWTRLGASGQIIKILKSHEIKDLVLIGSMRRPGLVELRPDLKTAELFGKIALKALGDNDLLTLIRSALEKEGFSVHGVHNFMQDLLTPQGAIGKYKPTKADHVDIERGLEAARELGRLDIGQTVIIQDGIILGVEAAEGTDELIKRCKHLLRKGRKGILVKTCKPQQDRDLDLPTIGPETVRLAASNGLGGIVAHAGHSLMIEPETVAQIADEHKMFVVGVDLNNPVS